jgi:hypothetical protein
MKYLRVVLFGPEPIVDAVKPRGTLIELVYRLPHGTLLICIIGVVERTRRVSNNKTIKASCQNLRLGVFTARIKPGLSITCSSGRLTAFRIGTCPN